jgi:hypothetical protein
METTADDLIKSKERIKRYMLCCMRSETPETGPADGFLLLPLNSNLQTEKSILKVKSRHSGVCLL